MTHSYVSCDMSLVCVVLRVAVYVLQCVCCSVLCGMIHSYVPCDVSFVCVVLRVAVHVL